MKEITKTIYVAIDGREFDSEKEALTHEEKIQEAGRILDILPPAIKEFTDPETQFLQHDPAVFEKFRAEMLLFGRRYVHYPQTKDLFAHCLKHNHPYFPLRVAEDALYFGVLAYQTACYRIHCTDMKYREWQQPYFAYEANKVIMKEQEAA